MPAEDSLGLYTPESAKKRGILRYPTAITGVFLRLAQDIGIDLHIDALHPFVSHAKRFTQARMQGARLQEIEDKERSRLINILKRHDGIRGIEFQDENLALEIHPSETTTWNRDLLKEALGDAYTAYTKEEACVAISIPPGVHTKDGTPITPELIYVAFQGALRDLGITADEKIMDTLTKLTYVDEERIQKLEDNGKLQLPEGTKTTTRRWTFTPRRLRRWENQL